jgi:hypothetical protein
MIRKGWKDGLVQFLGSPLLFRCAIVLWLATVEVRVIDEFKWRQEATSLLRDMGTVIQGHESRLSIAVARRDPNDGTSWYAPDMARPYPIHFDPNGLMHFGPSDGNGAELIREAIEAAEEH